MHIRNFYRIAWESFFSKDIYKEACFALENFILKYLSILILLTSLPSLVINLYYVISINPNIIKTNIYEANDSYSSMHDINSFISTILVQLPDITISNGTAQSSINQPLKLYLPYTNNVFAIIDTSGEITSLDNTDAKILVTANNIIFKSNNSNKIQYFSYPIEKIFGNHTEIFLNPETIVDIIKQLKTILIWIIPFVFFPGAILISLFYIIIKSLIFSLLGLLYIKIILNRDMQYRHAFRIIALSNTPSIIISFTLSLIPISTIIFVKLTYWIVVLSSTGYAIFAMQSVLDNSKK